MKKILILIMVFFVLTACTKKEQEHAKKNSKSDTPKQTESVDKNNKKEEQTKSEEQTAEKNEDSVPVFSGVDFENVWNISNAHSGAKLEIFDVSETKFDFSLSAYSGGNTGGVDGTALLTENNKAVFKDGQGCELNFSLNNDTLSVKQTDACSTYGGMGVIFEGNYQKGEPKEVNVSLLDLGVFQNQQQDKDFKELVGDKYKSFVDNMQIISEGEDLDGLNARVYSGGVRGLYTIQEAIVMYDDQGYYWAATIDGDKVLYFSNHPDYSNTNANLPKTIDKWRKNFSKLKVTFMN